jgi:hypothetical protein
MESNDFAAASHCRACRRNRAGHRLALLFIKEIPRDAETIELFKKFAGTGPLPPR